MIDWIRMFHITSKMHLTASEFLSVLISAFLKRLENVLVITDVFSNWTIAVPDSGLDDPISSSSVS